MLWACCCTFVLYSLLEVSDEKVFSAEKKLPMAAVRLLSSSSSLKTPVRYVSASLREAL